VVAADYEGCLVCTGWPPEENASLHRVRYVEIASGVAVAREAARERNRQRVREELDRKLRER